MKKIMFMAAAALLLASCCNKTKCTCGCAECCCTQDDTEAVETLTATVADRTNVDLSTFPVDDEGYIVLFDGETLNGWRGYGMDEPPTSWTVSVGAITLKGSGTGEAQVEGGGDLIFAHKFKNFQLELEYKISKGGNSGIFYLAQEVKGETEGVVDYLPIWQSCSEFQVLDNDNHPDAQLGKDGNRQSASL